MVRILSSLKWEFFINEFNFFKLRISLGAIQVKMVEMNSPGSWVQGTIILYPGGQIFPHELDLCGLLIYSFVGMPRGQTVGRRTQYIHLK